jgi:hypothetical protein
MKFALLVSGAVGFAVVAATGAAAERQPDLILRDAALGCLAMAFIGRWFWRVVEGAFAETMNTRRAAAEAAEAEAAKPAASTPPAKTPSTRPATTPVPTGPVRQA